MSSTLAFPLPDHSPDHDPLRHHQHTSSSLTPSHNLSPPPPAPAQQQGQTDPPSPNAGSAHFETPGASSSVLSCYSDLEEDPFFGAAFDGAGGVTSLLEDDGAEWQQPLSHTPSATFAAAHDAESLYPLTPERTLSLHSASPHPDRQAAARAVHTISPQELQKPFRPDPVVAQQPQLTPSQSSSSRASEDGLAPAPPPANMHGHSPRVTVSVWDQDHHSPTRPVERTLDDGELGPGAASPGDLISAAASPPPPRDSAGRWQPDPLTGQAGLGPAERLADETPSINELASRRLSDERNEEVGRWLSENLDEVSAPREGPEVDLRALEQSRAAADDGIPLGDATQNRYQPGQTYYAPTGRQMNEVDRDIIARDRNWSNAPMLPHIMRAHPGHSQPETSQAAIDRMFRDNDSMISRQATWGTRRWSIQSTADLDVDGALSGGFLKKLSITPSPDLGNRVGGFFRDFVRRPSISSLRKRRGSNASNASNASDDGRRPSGAASPPTDKRDSLGSPHLAPPGRTLSRGRRSKPSINTSLASAGGGADQGGSRSVRKSSVGALSITSPRGIMQNLKVENPLQRPRSRSEAPKPTSAAGGGGSHPNLIGMWRATGGPPVAALGGRSSGAPAVPDGEGGNDDDDDDGDADVGQGREDGGVGGKANAIDGITPDFAGFQEHVRMLNPTMAPENAYLVDRIAHQQTVRYKTLLGLRVKHLGLGANCPCGSLCVALGNQANVLDQAGDARGPARPASHAPDDDDINDDDDEGDGGSGSDAGEGIISQDSFPQDIPMPPTRRLPAELECQLCYAQKSFTKPSDWTKHVHEDVQPFTCTWDQCRDDKLFKRKADWVRHENEGHRHLEWWTCDVDDCRHTCYRRDNFLQHLVREHKFQEPSVRTRAAVKKSGGGDPTWSKVDECHVLNNRPPQEEPCRFCGKTYQTWKELTVHLAKHMEQLALPVLRLVEAKGREIDADTIISPVRDPPPRQTFTMAAAARGPDQVVADDAGALYAFPGAQGPPANVYPDVGPYGVYPVLPAGQQQFGGNQGGSYGPQAFDGMGRALHHQQQHQQQHHPHPHHHHHHQHDPMAMAGASTGYGPGADADPYMAMAAGGGGGGADGGGLEAFPALPDGLGLDMGAMGAPMGYGGGGGGGMMDPSTASASPFSGHGSASPYVRSPHQPANSGAPDAGWGGGGMYGFQ